MSEAPLRPVHAPADRDGIHQCCGIREADVTQGESSSNLLDVTCDGPGHVLDEATRDRLAALKRLLEAQA